MRIQPLELAPPPYRPLVSVLVANYNYACFVGRAIASLQEQTYGRFEAIVCDDGSTDDSARVVESYARRDPRIRLVRQENRGMAAALNAAFAEARGDLIALLDSDDEWLPERLERVIPRFRTTSGAGLVTHPLCAVNAAGEVLKLRHPRRLDGGWLGPSMLEGREPGLPPSSGLTFHREVAARVFPLPARFRSGADKVAEDRAALIARVAVVREPLARYSIHGANLTGLGSPVTLDGLERNFAFLGQLWEDRAEFVEREHGFRPDVAPWRDIESAHFFLARRLLTGTGGAAHLLRALASPWKRAAWRVLLALPRPAASLGLRLWWTENTVKRFFRNTWDLVAQ